MAADDRIVKRRGRGAVSNRSGRFESLTRLAFDDGWGSLDQPLEALATEVSDESIRTILSRNDSPDVPFSQSINPYRGCEHGCAYCFARPTHAYLGLSPGIDFETKIRAKPQAASVLRRELARPSYRCQVIALGANTDPYQPAERSRRITRSVLELLAECNHPVSIVTKSALVLRDLDLLGPMAERGLASVFLSVTTLSPELARALEPRAAAPHRRLSVIAALSDAGVPVGVLASPIIPALNDHEIEAIVDAVADAGARSARTLLLRLPLELKDLFREWLEEHAPDRANRVLSLLRQCRDGELYDPQFGTRMRGSGPVAEAIARRFALACQRRGLAEPLPALDTSNFRAPEPTPQLRLW